jgi:hypothetical protein
MAKKVKKRDFTLADLGDISSASDDESSTVKSVQVAVSGR